MRESFYEERIDLWLTMPWFEEHEVLENRDLMVFVPGFVDSLNVDNEEGRGGKLLR